MANQADRLTPLGLGQFFSHGLGLVITTGSEMDGRAAVADDSAARQTENDRALAVQAVFPGPRPVAQNLFYPGYTAQAGLGLSGRRPLRPYFFVPGP